MPRYSRTRRRPLKPIPIWFAEKLRRHDLLTPQTVIDFEELISQPLILLPKAISTSCDAVAEQLGMVLLLTQPKGVVKYPRSYPFYQPVTTWATGWDGEKYYRVGTLLACDRSDAAIEYRPYNWRQDPGCGLPLGHPMNPPDPTIKDPTTHTKTPPSLSSARRCLSEVQQYALPF